MTIRSLGYQTDLFFPRFDAEVTDRGDYMVVRTPSNPTYYWGNFLLFAHPPTESDFERWRTLFVDEIGSPPQVKHQAFGWDGMKGEVGELVAFFNAGFNLEDSIVLATKTVSRPEKYNEDVQIRPLTEDWEWDAVLENHVSCRDEIHSEASYRSYSARQLARYRAMSDAGLGCWFGGFLGGRLAADLGLFVSDGIGRFQQVGTHPDFRRRGICGALVHQCSEYAFQRMGAEKLVIVADAHYHATGIYESVGFRAVERQMGITWWNDGSE